METTAKEPASLSATKRALVALKTLQAKHEALEKRYSEPIAIIGIGCRFPGGADSPAAFWRVLHDGIDTMVEVPADRWDLEAFFDADPDTPGKMYVRHGGFLEAIDGFDAAFFGISPREAASMDPQQRLILEVCWEALENAGQPPDRLYGSATGVFVGISSYDYGLNLVSSSDYDQIDPYFGTGNSLCVAAGRLSYTLGLNGPCVSLDTACSSSLLAIHLASQSLRAGECDLAIAGGVNLILEPGVNVSYCKAHMLAADGRCKTFDAAADGYSRGEGCGMLVLKRLSRALSDGDPIAAVVRGSAVNQDGSSGGLTVPSGPSQEKVLRQALANARVQPHQVDYVEAHGTGTSLGDPIEVGALNAVYGQGREADAPLAIGSVKTNIGHLEAAAGMAGVMKVVLGMQHEEIPRHLHFATPNPLIPWQEMNIEVAAAGRPWPATGKLRLAGISAFGFGGTNVHLILEEPPPTETATAAIDPALQLVTLSAKSAKSLKALAERYIAFLDEQPDASVADIGFTTSTARTYFAQRLSVVADSTALLRDRLGAFVEGRETIGVQAGQAPGGGNNDIVFLFTGQGSQDLRMAAELYTTQPTFRRVLERCDAILRPYLDKPLLEVLYPPAGETSPLDETRYTQPGLFAVEYALAELWQSWGITPQVVMGHSMGEYVAACVAGVFSLEDGLRLIAERGRLMANLAGEGAMATVFADEARVSEALAAHAGEVSLAAVNGPEVVVIAGTRAAVATVLADLGEQRVRSIPLNISQAFHSPLTEAVLPAFEQVAAQVSFSPPRLKLISNVSGGMAGAEIAGPDYWCRHLRQPVRFVKSMRTLHRQGYEIFIEIGPEPELLGLDQCLPEGIGPDLATPVAWLPSLRSGRSDWEQLLESLSTLYIRGVEVDWAGFHRDYPRRRVALPTYAFDHQSYWLKADRKPTSSNRIDGARTPLMAQLAAGKVDGLIEALTTSGKFSPEESDLLPRVCDLFARQLQQEALVAGVKDWFYSLTWQPQPPTAAQDEGDATAHHWLILADRGDETAARLASSVRVHSGVCVLAYSGDRFARETVDSFTLDPGDRRQLARLFEELTLDRRPDRVVHLWGSNKLADNPFPALPTGDAMLQASLNACAGLLHLYQQLIHGEGPEKPRLWVVTRGSATLGDGMGPWALALAPLWGMGKIFGLEHPEHWGGLIDLEPGGSEQEAETLLREILGGAGEEDQICFRDGQRHVARLVPAELQPATRAARVRADGAYLITGGQGALGLRIAQRLVEQGARYLVLTGRRDPSAQAQEAAERMTAAGAKIRFLKADVADEAAMREGFAEIARMQWPPLRGVVNAAGIAGFDTVEDLEAEALRRVLHAKVAGAWVLHRLTRDLPLDFFVCFSSIASVWGSMGQAHYAAANQFLDLLVHFRRRQGQPALSVNWGPWGGGGMTTSEAQDWLDRMGVKAMAPEQALAAFDALCASDTSQAAVADVDWSLFKAVYEARRRRPLLDAIEVASTSDAETPSVEAAAFLDELAEAPVSERQRLLATLILQQMAKVLWLKDTHLPDRAQGFFELGMDSITIIQMMTKLKTYLGRSVPPTLAFEYSSPDRLAAYLLTEVLQIDHAAVAPKGDGRAEEDERQLVADIEDLEEADIKALIDDELSILIEGE